MDTEIKDIDAYGEYKIQANRGFERFVGKYLARGGNITASENELWHPTRLVMVEFPSRKNIEVFLGPDDYSPIKAIRHNKAKTTLCIIDGA